jgi:hypothetical protein
VRQTQKRLDALTIAHTVLGDPDLGPRLGIDRRALKKARAVLARVIAGTKMPIARSRMGNKNAAQKHTEYWNYLARNCGWIKPGYSPKQLTALLLAASAPVFPVQTTAEAVRNFVYRFLKRARK